MKIDNWYRIVPLKMELNEQTDLDSWRDWLAKVMTLLAAIGLPIGMLITLPVLIREKQYALIALDTVLWLLMVNQAFGKNRSYRMNAYVFLAVIYTMTIIFFVRLGPIHARPTWLVLCAIMACLTFGLRAATLSVAFNAVILIMLYVFMGPENRAWAAEYEAPFSRWVMFVVNVSIITLAVSVPVGFLLNRLDRSLRDIRDAHEKLSLESENLKNSYSLLKIEVDQRRQAERRLRESEERLRSFCNALPDLAFVLDEDGRYIEIVTTEEHLLYKDIDSVQGRIMSDILPNEVSEPAMEAIQQTIQTGKTQVFQYELDVPAGKRWFEARIAPMRTAHNGKSYVTCLSRDITEPKQAEEALKQSEERYRSLVENTLDGYFIFEIPSGNFVFINQRISNLSGYTLQEGLTLTIWDVVDPEEHHPIQNLIEALMESRGSSFSSQTYSVIRKDGSKFQAEVSTSLVTYQGKPVIQGILRDVTKEKKLQLQLQHSQKMEAIGTLAGGIAHDFNNLLMGIQGRASLMLIDVDSNHSHFDHLKAIEEYILGASDLTKQLLGFARGGKYVVKPTDLNNLIKKSSEMFSRTRKEIKIHRKFQQDAWTVEVDQSQIEQVLLNLYINAWQAMPPGGELYLQTENIQLDEEYARSHFVQPGRYLKISITDTGVGMDEATRQKIFDPFFTTKEIGRGSGLGLASAYGIIKNHDGIINVYTEKGVGTTFNIYLLASEKELVEKAEPAAELLMGSEMVLLVDDEEMIMAVGIPMLENLGYKVIVAKNGQAAIDLYQNKKEEIDIVILDMIMPDIDGGETFDRLKEINPEIKVLLSSGYSINSQAREILERGCDGFIQKPFNLYQLSLKLREILDR